MKPIIEIKDLFYSYNKKENVLENINLNIFGGDFLGIIGPNGGGKTTLLKIMLGLLEPTNGNITIFGKKPQKISKHIGYVPQYSKHNPSFPITLEEVVLQGTLNSRSNFIFFRKNIKQLAEQAMDSLGILDRRKSNFGELSGGLKQRGLIARAIVSNPSILILDEPVASVDSSVESDIFDMLKELNSKMTIIMVSHDLGFVSGYVNRVACINKRLSCKDTSSLELKIEDIYNKNTKMIKHSCGL